MAPVLTPEQAAQALGLSKEAAAKAAEMSPAEAAQYLGIAVKEADSFATPVPPVAPPEPITQDPPPAEPPA